MLWALLGTILDSQTPYIPISTQLNTAKTPKQSCMHFIDFLAQLSLLLVLRKFKKEEKSTSTRCFFSEKSTLVSVSIFHLLHISYGYQIVIYLLATYVSPIYYLSITHKTTFHSNIQLEFFKCKCLSEVRIEFVSNLAVAFKIGIKI